MEQATRHSDYIELASVEEVRKQLLKLVRPVAIREWIAAGDAMGRILADPVVASVHLPPVHVSAMDGYAINSADIQTDLPQIWRVSQRIAAGDTPEVLETGTAVRIFTGAPLPPGADSVVMQEECKEGEMGMRFTHPIKRGQHVRRQGEVFREGDILLPAGRRLRVADAGLIAAAGHAWIMVWSRVKVAVVTSGSELMDPGTEPEPMKIYNANYAQLRSLLKQLPVDIIGCHSVGDDLEETVELLETLSERCDLILTSGGVSVGDEDHIRPAIERLGEIKHWRVNLKPGKPFLFGQIGKAQTPILGFPGNPVSVFVAWLLFGRPFILQCGGSERIKMVPWMVSADFDIPLSGSRNEYIRVNLEPREDGLWCSLAGDQSSGNMRSLSKADGLAMIPAHSSISRGHLIGFHPLTELLYG